MSQQQFESVPVNLPPTESQRGAAQKTTSWLPVDLNGDAALTIKISPYQVIIKDDFDPILLKNVVLTLDSL